MFSLAKMKVKAARLSSRILLGRVATDLPRYYLETISEGDIRLGAHLKRITPVREPETITWETADSATPPWFERSHAFDSLCRHEVRDVCVGPHSGAVWLPGGFVLGPSHGRLAKALSYGGVRLDLADRVVPVAAPAPVFALPHVTYFHWLVETVPNLLRLASDSSPFVLLCTRQRPRYVNDTLRLIFGESWRSRLLEVDHPARVPEAVFYSAPSAGFAHPADAEWVRNWFRSRLPAGAANPFGHSKIYISRRHSLRRNFDDEAKIESRVEQMGSHIVHAQNYSFADQEAGFAGVTHLAGLHGAGLSNMIFAAPGATIHEIFPKRQGDSKNRGTDLRHCYAWLAHALNHSYHHELAEMSA